MSAAEHDSPEHDAAGKRAAMADLQDRLTQFGRMVSDLREGLPEQHAAALRRIEQGIGGLATRVSTLGGEEARTPSIWAAERDADDVWDQEQAEALMQAYESAEPGYAASDGNAEPGPPVFSPAPGEIGEAARDTKWLDTRLADITALLQRGLKEASPAGELAALDRRLEQFERRLDSVLSDAARATGRDALQVIEAHVGDLAERVAAIGQQLGRLDAMDAKLGELASAFERQQRVQPASSPSEETVSALVDAAAEAAATRVAALFPPEGAGEARIGALEALVQDYIAERRQSQADSAGIVRSIEDALARIAERMDSMEAARLDVADAPPQEHPDPDHHRLAEAYAAGARVLGQDFRLPSLHASDYVTSSHGEGARSPAGLAPDDEKPACHEDGDSSLHGPVVRATGMSATGGRTAESRAGLVGLGLERLRSWTQFASGGHGANFLFGMTIVLLFGAGFLAVDRLATAPPAGGLSGPDEARTIVEMAPTPPHEPDRRSPAYRAGAGEAPSMGATPIALPRVTDESPAARADDKMTGALEGMAALKQAADGGDAFAQFEIGRRFSDGDGVPQDAARAAAWYERAAARGLALAQFRLATAFERGTGVAVDKARAKVWYRRAAEQGYARAMHNLGVMMAEGGEPEADYAAAAGWFEQAAERGLADSQFNLAILRESGRGVLRDLTEAYKWFALAGRQGDRAASRRLDQVKAAMWPDEVAAAERKLAEWRPAPTEPAVVAGPQSGVAGR